MFTYLPRLTTVHPLSTEMPPFGLDSKSFDGVNQDRFSKNRFPSVLPIDLNINSPSLATWTFSSYHNSFDNGGLLLTERWLWNLKVFVSKLVSPIRDHSLIT